VCFADDEGSGVICVSLMMNLRVSCSFFIPTLIFVLAMYFLLGTLYLGSSIVTNLINTMSYTEDAGW